MTRRIGAVLLAVVVATAVSGCSGGGGASGSVAPVVPTPTPLPVPSGAAEVRAQTIPAATGGTVTLASGSSVTIAPTALAQDAVVQLAYVPQANLPPSSANFTSAAPALHLAFFAKGSPTSGRLRWIRADGSSPAITLAFKLPADAIPNFDGFALPILRIYGAGGSSTDISAAPNVDPASGILTFVLPSSVPAFTQAMDLFFIHLVSKVTPCGVQGVFAPGLRYYDPGSRTWATGAPPMQPVHPLVLLHGVRSCVEDTFLPTTVDRLRQDGGYDAVIGYDYDWLQTPAQIVSQMSSDLNGLGFRHVDIAAHSYGTVVAMALVPSLSAAKIDNMVLYGGPLDGAYIANKNFAYTVLAILPSFLALPAGETLLLKADWLATFVQGNARLTSIRSAMMAAPNAPVRIIKVAGTVPYAVETTDAFRLIFGPVFGPKFPAYDGLITQDSALLPSVQGQPRKGSHVTVPAATLEFSAALNHSQLVPDQGIEQSDVATSLAFEFNDADPASGLYPVGGGIVFLKGVGSTSYVAFLYPNGSGTASLEPATLQAQYFSGRPASVPTAQTIPGETDANFFAASLVNSPPTLLTATPTDTMQFDLTTSSGVVYPQEYTMNYYAFPPCSSCLGQSPTDVRRIIRGYHPAPSRHGVRAMDPY